VEKSLGSVDILPVLAGGAGTISTLLRKARCAEIQGLTQVSTVTSYSIYFLVRMPTVRSTFSARSAPHAGTRCSR